MSWSVTVPRTTCPFQALSNSLKPTTTTFQDTLGAIIPLSTSKLRNPPKKMSRSKQTQSKEGSPNRISHQIKFTKRISTQKFTQKSKQCSIPTTPVSSMLPLEEKLKPPHDNSSCGNYLKKAVNFANANDTSSKKKKKKQHPHLKAYQLEVLGHDHSISRLDDIGVSTAQMLSPFPPITRARLFNQGRIVIGEAR